MVYQDPKRKITLDGVEILCHEFTVTRYRRIKSATLRYTDLAGAEHMVTGVYAAYMGDDDIHLFTSLEVLRQARRSVVSTQG